MKIRDLKDRKELKEIYQTGKSLVKVTAHLAADLSRSAVQKTVEYASDNHIGSKNEYIKELENKLEEKEKEIKILKRRLAKECWKKQK